MNRKSWPQVALIALAVAIAAGVGVALWMRHEQNVSAAALPNAARIQQVEGQVALSNGLAYENQNGQSSAATDQWVVATANQPFSVGDRIYTRDNSRTSIAFTGRNFARLDPNTSLDLLAFDENRTQLALREGSAIFDVGYLAPGQLFEVATPYGAVDFNQPGLYNIGFQNDGSVLVSVLSGLAQVVGLGGNGQIGKGEILTLVGQTAADVVLSRLDGRNAGYLVDDYYRYQYPQTYDGRYRDYNVYLSDPYYFDPYRRYASYRYVSGVLPGVYDLDYYGDWQSLNGYGFAWRPRVDVGWAPYQEGYWLADYPYGPTWVSTEPWGYAPYHYGRWAYVGNQWYWVPDGVNTSPVYSPALVGFVPFDANQIGWVPLGPGDPYAPRYYDASWHPYYLSRTDIVQPHLVNLGVPGAVAVLPVDQFGRIVDGRRIGRVDPQALAQVRPVLDPLTLTPLRNAVIHSAWGRGKIDLPPGIAKKLDETRVVTSVVPPGPPFRKNLARELRVEGVPEKAKGEKLKIRDERGNQSARSQQDNQQLSPQPQDSKAAEREARQIEREQKKVEKRSVQPSGGAEGARVANPARREVPNMERPAKPERAKPVPQNAAPQRVEKQEVKKAQPAQQQIEQQQVHPRREPKAVQSNPAPVQKQQQPRGKAEYKGPPVSPQGGSKGKGRKP